MITIPGSVSGNRQDEATDELLEYMVRKVREGIEAACRGEVYPIDEAEAMIRRELGIRLRAGPIFRRGSKIAESLRP